MLISYFVGIHFNVYLLQNFVFNSYDRSTSKLQLMISSKERRDLLPWQSIFVTITSAYKFEVYLL